MFLRLFDSPAVNFFPNREVGSKRLKVSRRSCDAVCPVSAFFVSRNAVPPAFRRMRR